MRLIWETVKRSHLEPINCINDTGQPMARKSHYFGIGRDSGGGDESERGP